MWRVPLPPTSALRFPTSPLPRVVGFRSEGRKSSNCLQNWRRRARTRVRVLVSNLIGEHCLPRLCAVRRSGHSGTEGNCRVRACVLSLSRRVAAGDLDNWISLLSQSRPAADCVACPDLQAWVFLFFTPGKTEAGCSGERIPWHLLIPVVRAIFVHYHINPYINSMS